MERHNSREVNTDRLTELYDSHADAIYRYCFFRIFSKTRAEELVQDAFFKLWRYMEEGRQIENERALLYTIATHLIIDDKRKRKEESLDTMLEDGGEEPVEQGNTAVTNVMMRELYDAVATLEEEEQRLFALRFIEDLDPKEIAELNGTSANTVSVQLNRIKKKLAHHFNEEEF